jgi:hypothetical protein
MSQSRRLLLHSNSNDINRDDIKENGKARCFICKSDICEDDGRIEDIFSYTYKNKKVCLSESVKGVSLSIKPPSTLITPCKCELTAHLICMKRYIVYNLQYRCEQCKSYFNIEYENNGKVFAYIVNTLLIVFLIAFHLGLYGLAILLLFDVILIEYKIIYWKYIIFAILVLLNKVLVIFSIRIYKNIKYDRNMVVSGHILIESESIPTFTKIKAFSQYLENTYHCSKSGLIDRKVEIHSKQNIEKNKTYISKFIKEFNNKYHLEINSMINKFKKHNSNSKLPNSKNKKNDRFSNMKLAMIDENVETKNLIDKNVNELNSIKEHFSEEEDVKGDIPIEKMLQMQVNKKNLKDLPSKPNLESKLQKPDTSNFNCDSIIE